MASSLSITTYSHDMNGCQLHDKTWNHKNTTMYDIWHMEAVWDVNTIHKWVHSATDLIPCWKRRVVVVPTFSSLVTLKAIVTITSDTCIYGHVYMYMHKNAGLTTDSTCSVWCRGWSAYMRRCISAFMSILWLYSSFTKQRYIWLIVRLVRYDCFVLESWILNALPLLSYHRITYDYGDLTRNMCYVSIISHAL